MSLKKKSITGVFWGITGSGFTQGLNFLVYIVLARLVSLEEFATVAFAFLVIEFVSIFMSVGVNQNLIRRDVWCDEFASSSHWLLILISSAISLFMVFCVAPIIYIYYSHTTAYILLTLSVIPIINALRMCHLAKMQRNFQNKKIMLIETSAVCVGSFVSIGLALYGFGAWSIVIGRILQSISSAGTTWFYSSFSVRFSIKKAHVQETMTFGLPLFYMAFLSFFSSKSLNILIGTLFGPISFAFISMVQRIHSMIAQLTLTQLNNILAATFPRVDEDALPSTFYRIIRMAAFFILPVYLGIGAIAEPLIQLILGSKWQPSALLVTIFCFSAPASVLAWFLPNLLIAKGQTKSALWLKLIATFASVTAPLVSFPFGITAMVVASVVSIYISMMANYWIVKKYVNISLRESIRNCLPFLIASLIMFVFIMLLDKSILVSELSTVTKLIVYIIGGSILYSLFLFVFYRKFLYTVTNELHILKITK